MGYLDSSYLVFKYLKARQFDKRMQTTVNINLNNEKATNTNRANMMQMNYERNKTKLENFHSAEIARIQADLNNAQDQTTKEKLKDALKEAEQARDLALARLKAEYEDSTNQMTLQAHKRDSYYQMQQKLWDERYNIDNGLYDKAKKDRDQALASLYPQPKTTTTT